MALPALGVAYAKSLLTQPGNRIELGRPDPPPIAEDYDASVLGLIFVGKNAPPEHRLHAQCRKQAGGDCETVQGLAATNCEAFAYGNGWSSTAFTAAKTTADALVPMATDARATAVSAGLRRIKRSAWPMSLNMQV